MKVDFVSDLHVDFWVSQVNPQHKQFKLQLANFVDMLLPHDKSKLGDVLLVAGDLGHYNLQTKFLLMELKKYYKNVLVTFGNHDMYLLTKNIVKKYKANSENRLLELKEMCEELGVHYLDGQVVEVDGVTFGGAGSWYDLPTVEKVQKWKNVMNDAKYVYKGAPKTMGGMYSSAYTRAVTNWDTQSFWLKEKAKLEKVAKEGCNVFVTHVGLVYPPNDKVNPSYVGDENNMFYFTDNLQLLKESGCEVHVHGHTHDNLEYVVDGVKVLCNPLGYPDDNTYCFVKQFEL